MADETQTCPRRMLEVGPWERAENLDHWQQRDGQPCCSFCGSLHPDRFMELVRDGWLVGPTDKPYKAYLSAPDGGREGKFYYLHLSDAQQGEFIELVNTGRMQISYPGHFYVLPFFTKPQATTE